jgi:hypothetical protein
VLFPPDTLSALGVVIAKENDTHGVVLQQLVAKFRKVVRRPFFDLRKTHSTEADNGMFFLKNPVFFRKPPSK